MKHIIFILFTRYFLLIIFSLLVFEAYPQRKVSGVVFDALYETAILGAVIHEDETDNGTITDIDGFFSITTTKDTCLLNFSSGYITKTVRITQDTIIHVFLEGVRDISDDEFVASRPDYRQNKNRFPVWTYHENDVNIHGISVGLLPFEGFFNEGRRYSNTNGIRLELIGLGFFVPLIPEMPNFEKGYEERINGLSLSASGAVCDCLINGLGVGGIGHIYKQVNGISATMFNVIGKQNGIMVAVINMSDIMNGLQLGVANGNESEANGVQIGIIGNETEVMKGLQVGLINKSKNLRGIQIGLWNVNQKRKLPLINWNFKRTKGQKTNEQE